MATRRDLIWRDAQGEQLLHVLTGNSSLAGVMSSLAAKSNAVVNDWWEASNNPGSSSPVVATYPTVRVQAVLIFRSSSSGSIAKLWIPAPVNSIFLPDSVTVDPAQIGGIISAVEGTILAGDSTPVDTFVGGQSFASRVNAIASLQVFL